MPFVPHPWLRSGHLQTIFGNWLHTTAIRPGETLHYVDLPDGDALVLHDDPPTTAANVPRLAILFHGLGGCHGSQYLQRISVRLNGRGVRTIRVDLRGCGAGETLARHIFHAGRSDDLLQAICFTAAQYPESAITACGFSLGAGMLLKMLSEATESLPANLDSAFAVAPPIDLALCCDFLSRGASQIYDRYYARRMWNIFQQCKVKLHGAADLVISRPPTRLADFDRQVTAPLGGFASLEDYYTSASPKRLLSRIETATLLVVAEDDPIVPVSIFDDAEISPSCQLMRVPGGGHLGFVSATSDNGSRNRRWLESQLVDWIVKLDE